MTKSALFYLSLFLVILSVAGCDDDCPRVAVVADIDATLTTSDIEFFIQGTDPDYDPAMRPGAHTLLQRYAELGYEVYYVTARGESMTLVDGSSAREATVEWLEAHQFPYAGERSLYLAPAGALTGAAAIEYKTTSLEGLIAQGVELRYAYGNATTDMEAFLAAGIPGERIFYVGQDGPSDYDVETISDDDAYSAHIDSFLAAEVEDVTCP